jgi:SEC-C motif-containing protein
MSKKSPKLICPCGTVLYYADCCQPIHQGEIASTAEALMRSRYSAYALDLPTYLLASWHPSSRPKQLELESQMQWFKLTIVDSQAGQQADTTGLVSFIARYKINGKAARLTEISEFVYEDGQWFYLGAQ